MTANRWWVKMAARWLARVDGVSSMLQLAMLVLTGISTATLTLNQYGHGQYAWPLIAIVSVGMLIFTYLYTEGGVWNQMSRDRKDLSTNWAGPTMRIDDELIGCAVFAALNGRPPNDEERDAISTAVEVPWNDYRDGFVIEQD